MNERGNCAICTKETALTKDGLIRGHGGCPGGGSAPSGPWAKDTDQDDVVQVYVPEQPARKEEPMTVDDFESAPEPKPRVDRDRWGRYKLSHPVTGKTQAWQRATTFADMCENMFTVGLWSQRHVLMGAVQRPDLLEVATGLDVKQDAKQLNEIADKLKEVSGANVSANLGTAFHSATEYVDEGGAVENVSPRFRAGVKAYQAELDAYGIEVIPDLIERRVVVTDLDVAGTFDRIVLIKADSVAGRWLRITRDTYVIGDIKTGSSVELGKRKIAVQLWLYANGVNTSGIYRPTSDTEGYWETDIKVSEVFGIVMHVPQGNGVCELERIDLVDGKRVAGVCAQVRAERKAPGFAERMSREPGAMSRTPGELEPVSRQSTPYLRLLSQEVSRDGLAGLRMSQGVDPGTGMSQVSPGSDVVKEAQQILSGPVSPPAGPTWEERFARVGSRAEASELYRMAKAQGVSGTQLTRLVVIGLETLTRLGV